VGLKPRRVTRCAANQSRSAAPDGASTVRCLPVDVCQTRLRSRNKVVPV